VKDKNMEETLAALFAYWRDSRTTGEKFGDFTHRKGKEDLLAFMDGYTVTEEDLKDDKMYDEDADSESDASVAEITPVVTQDQLQEEMAKVTRATGPEATKAEMEARIALDKEVAKETELGQVTRIGTREEVEKILAEADKKAKAESDAAAAMNRAQQSAEEERQRMKEEEEAKAKASEPAAQVNGVEEKAAETVAKAAEAAAVDGIEAQTVTSEAVNHAAAAPASATSSGLIREVFAYRVFKKNPQWCVEWTADQTVSWESWDKLDSDALREKARALQDSVA
jgi:hypothetical protein